MTGPIHRQQTRRRWSALCLALAATTVAAGCSTALTGTPATGVVITETPPVETVLTTTTVVPPPTTVIDDRTAEVVMDEPADRDNWVSMLDQGTKGTLLVNLPAELKLKSAGDSDSAIEFSSDSDLIGGLSLNLRESSLPRGSAYTKRIETWYGAGKFADSTVKSEPLQYRTASGDKTITTAELAGEGRNLITGYYVWTMSDGSKMLSLFGVLVAPSGGSTTFSVEIPADAAGKVADGARLEMAGVFVSFAKALGQALSQRSGS